MEIINNTLQLSLVLNGEFIIKDNYAICVCVCGSVCLYTSVSIYTYEPVVNPYLWYVDNYII